jgi:hypothetical protein
MSLVYLASDHKFDQPLEIKWEISCTHCKISGQSNNEIQEPTENDNNGQAQCADVQEEKSSFDCATDMILDGITKCCNLFFEECNKKPNPMRALIQHRTNFILGVRNSIAACCDDIEKSNEFSSALASTTPIVKSGDKICLTPIISQSESVEKTKKTAKRTLFLSPRAMESQKLQAENIAKKSRTEE